MRSIDPMRSLGVLTCLLAMSSCASSSSNPSSSGDGGGSTADTGTGNSATLSGTINGTPFTAMSALSHVEADGSMDIIFSDKADLCTSLVAGKTRSGETLVQLYNLIKGADGTYAPALAPSDVKVAVLSSSCAVGYSARASANSAFTINLTEADSTAAAGTASITFDSSSHLSGSFSAPACASILSATDVCQ